MLVTVLTPMSGNERHCHLSTLVPILMSSASSLLKILMISGAKMANVIDMIIKMIVASSVVNTNDFRTLSCSPAP